jgi:hypothetical protein
MDRTTLTAALKPLQRDGLVDVPAGLYCHQIGDMI